MYAGEVGLQSESKITVARILLVEDESDLAENLSRYLKGQNHVTEVVATADDASFRLSSYEYDVIILDIGLPDDTGLSVLRKYRASGGQTPVIFLTGRSEIEEKEEGLDCGADDYVTKPYDIRELSARVRAILRRPKLTRDPVIVVGDLELDTKYVRARLRGKDLELAPIEYSLLEFFARHPDEHFTAQTLMDRVWSAESESSTDVVRVHITRLRKKLQADSQQQVIGTVRGLGYYLDSKALN